MLVASVTIKSSAVSVSSFPELGGWDSAPSRPSGEPVLKKKGSAQPGVARNSATVSVAATRLSRNIIVVLLDRKMLVASQRATSLRAESAALRDFDAPQNSSNAFKARGPSPPKSCAKVQD